MWHDEKQTLANAVVMYEWLTCVQQMRPCCSSDFLISSYADGSSMVGGICYGNKMMMIMMKSLMMKSLMMHGLHDSTWKQDGEKHGMLLSVIKSLEITIAYILQVYYKTPNTTQFLSHFSIRLDISFQGYVIFICQS